MTETISAEHTDKLTTRQALKQALTDRQVLAMLILGFASGLPYVVVAGTLNAWFSTTDVNMASIGLLSWALLAYSFKFMWAAALQGRRTPLNLNVGPRRFWMFIFLAISTVGMGFLSLSDPPNGLGRIGLLALLIAVSSSCFDIVLAAWRIESARDGMHLDILSTVEQFGYRISSIVGGMLALILADYIGWRATFFAVTALLGATVIGVMMANPAVIEKSHKVVVSKLSSRQRNIGTLLVLMGWAFGFYLIANFAVGALTDPENHSARTFTRTQGPWVIISTVIWLFIISAILVWQDKTRPEVAPPESVEKPGVLGVLFVAIVEPMMELIGRLRWAAILVLAVVLTYRFTDLIWGGFAYPFYLGENYGALGHTLTEVAFASKLVGVFATIAGIALGGLAMLRFGRMPVFFVGAVMAAATNLLFADLALGARYTDPVLSVLQLDHLFEIFGKDIRMARLTSVIALENIAVGVASAASIAYLSSIASKQYATLQYALLVSLVFLLGVLGRPAIGEIIETQGFATAFILCAAFGGVASVLAGIEWIRIARLDKRAQPEPS